MIVLEKLAVIALRLGATNGEYNQGTGILIHNSLVLTSHMNLPTKKSAEKGEIVLPDGHLEANSYAIASLNEQPSRGLTRKLLPSRCFLTNTSLGVTVVGCEPVNSMVPLAIESVKVPPDVLNVGRSIYILGHIKHDEKRKGLITFGEGRISLEDEQVIEFYSLDGNVWAPGSAGFDERGNFAFLVGDSPSPSRENFGASSVQKCKKDSGLKQPGILVEFVREWMQTVCDLNELRKERPMSATLPLSNIKELDSDPGTGGTTFQGLRSAITSSVGNFSSVGTKGLPSTLGGNVDSATNKLTTERLIEPRRVPEKQLSRVTDGKNCYRPHSRLQNDFVTGFVKLDYFNKNTFSPDQMPITDAPNQDPNGGSWYGWGKRAPTPHPNLLSKEIMAEAADDYYQVKVGMPFQTKPEGNNQSDGQQSLLMPATDAPKQDENEPNSWYNWGKKALQMAVSDGVTEIPKEDSNVDSWYGWGKSVVPASGPFPPTDMKNVASYEHPPEVRLEVQNNPHQKISESCETKDPLVAKESEPQNAGLQPLRAKAWTTPKISTSARMQLDMHSQSGQVPSDSVNQRVPQVSSPEPRSPSSHFQRPKLTLHQAVKPPRELQYGQIHRSTTSPRSPNFQMPPWKPPGRDSGSPVQNSKFVFEESKAVPVGSPRQRAPCLLSCKPKIQRYDQKKSAEAGASLKKKERKKPGKPLWSAHSRVHKEDNNRKLATLPPRVAKPGEFPAVLFSSTRGRKDIRPVGLKDRKPAVRVIFKHKERDHCLNNRHARRFFQPSIPCMPSYSAVRDKICKPPQTSLKHAHTVLELDPLASTACPQTNLTEICNVQQISCLQALKETVLSVSGSPRGAGSSKGTASPKISSRKQIRSNEEILKEIEMLQAILRSPRGIVLPHEDPRWHSCPKLITDTDHQRTKVDPKLKCRGTGTSSCTSPRNTSNIRSDKRIGEKFSKRNSGFSCFQYWRNFMRHRKAVAVNMMKAIFLPRRTAPIDRHARCQSTSSLQSSPRRSPPHLQKTVCCIMWPLRMRKVHSPKYSYLHRHPHRPHCAQEAAHLLENLVNNKAASKPQLQSPGPLQSTPCCGSMTTVPLRPLRLRKDDKQDGSPKCSYPNHRQHRSHCAQEATSLQENLNNKVIVKCLGQSPLPREEIKRGQSPSPGAEREQQQSLHAVDPTVSSTRMPCLPWNVATSYCEDKLAKTEPDEWKRVPNSRPQSPIEVAPYYQPIVLTEEGVWTSLGDSPISVFPTHPTEANSCLDGEIASSPRKNKFNSSGVPRKVQRLCSPGPGRPRQTPRRVRTPRRVWTPTRVDSRSTSPTSLVALRDGTRAIQEFGGKRIISPLDVEMETMIFDTVNEEDPISKKSVSKKMLPACCMLETACPEKPAVVEVNKVNPSVAVPRKQARLAHNAPGQRKKFLAKISIAEIGTNVISSCSEDGTHLSEIGPIVRSEVRFATPAKSRPTASDQHGNHWVSRWRP